MTDPRDELIAAHRDYWRRRAWLWVMNATAAALLLGSFLGTMLVILWRE